MKLLKNISSIYDDESIEGYAYRLASINYCPFSYLELGKLSLISNSDEILKYLNRIRDLTGEEVKEGNLLHTWYVEYFGLPGLGLNNFSRFCSECLCDKPYHRLHWGLSFITICAKHKVFLLERCQNCNKRTTIQEIISSKCDECNGNLAESYRIISLETDYLNLDEYYNRSIYSSILTYREFIKLYKEFTVFLLIRILKIPLNEKEKNHLIYWGYLEDLPKLCETNLLAFEILEAWPSNAVFFLIKKFGIKPNRVIKDLLYFISKVDSLSLRKKLRESLYYEYGNISTDITLVERLKKKEL